MIRSLCFAAPCFASFLFPLPRAAMMLRCDDEGFRRTQFQIYSGESLPDVRLLHDAGNGPDTQGRTTMRTILHVRRRGHQFLARILRANYLADNSRRNGSLFSADGVGTAMSKPSDGLHAHFPHTTTTTCALHKLLTTVRREPPAAHFRNVVDACIVLWARLSI